MRRRDFLGLPLVRVFESREAKLRRMIASQIRGPVDVTLNKLALRARTTLQL